MVGLPSLHYRMEVPDKKDEVPRAGCPVCQVDFPLKCGDEEVSYENESLKEEDGSLLGYGNQAQKPTML